MIYGIKDKLPVNELLLFGLQLMLSVFVATVLIANICGVAVSGALAGAGLATLMYLAVTKYSSPMFVSNSGAFVAPVIAALAMGGYTAVAVGGVVTCLIYCLFGIIFTKISADKIYTVFPKALIGAVTVVIGIGLMGFIGSYIQVNGADNKWGIIVALFTMLVIAVVSHYAKGLAKILPLLFGTLAGYALCAILTLTGVCSFIDFSLFNNMKLFMLPDMAFAHLTKIPLSVLLPVVIMYAAFTVSAMMEAISDHAALSGIIDVDLFKNPGIGRLFIGEGCANLVGSLVGGLGICSYGEGVACVGFSKVASVAVTSVAASMLIILSVLAPVQIFIASIPSCVFGGAAIILYGYIACSGVKMLQKVDLNEQKNLIMVSVVLSLGISGIVIGGTTLAISGTALALVVGVILNIILKNKE